MAQQDSASTQKLRFEPITVAQIPRNPDGTCAENLYIYLPSPKRFILFVPKGERFTYNRQMALERHTIPALFVPAGESNSEVVTSPSAASESDGGDSVLDLEIMGAGKTQKTLKDIFKSLSESQQAPEEAFKKLENLADEIINVVAPEVDDMKSKMLENAQYIWLMNDACAITTVACLFAAANGFDSRRSFRDIVTSCLMMDLPLVRFSEEQCHAYLCDRAKLSNEERELFEKHPMEAYRLGKQSLRHFTDTALELILNHHELHNGAGYPRKIRSGSIFPLARVLASAVEVFETMKRSQIAGPAKTLAEAVKSLLDEEVPPHMRRHEREIFEKVVAFMGNPESSAAKSAGSNLKAA
jgi:hypothetical protein